MNLTEFAVKNVKPVLFVAILLCIAGAMAYSSFPVSILPEVTFPRVQVIAESADRPTKMVEASITRPLEEAFATIPGVAKVKSQTKKGSTEISIDFISGTDVLQAEQFVNAKVNEVRPTLPPDTATETERMNPTLFPVLGLTLKSDKLTPTELWSLATYEVKPRLSRVPGVAHVEVQGGAQPEIQVSLRVADLATYGLSTTDVSTALAGHNVIRSIGKVDHEYQQFQVMVDGQIPDLNEIKQVTVGERDGIPIRLEQVGDVRVAPTDQSTVVAANGHESVLINVIRQPSGNTVQMVEDVKKEVRSLRSSLPAGVEIQPFYDQSLLVREAIDSVRDAVLIGAVLSVVVLMLFLRDVRATLITAVTIPATLLVGFVFMRTANLTLNLMTLGALAVGIGLVIDDAIVVVEAVFNNLSTSPDIKSAVKAASGQIAVPMVSSTLTTVVVFLPLAFLTGVSGAFFSALAVTLAIALLVSLAFALTVSPTLCAAYLRKSSDKGEGKLFEGLSHGYLKTLGWSLRHPWIVIPVVLVVLGGTVLIKNQLTTGFMPEMDEGAFVLDYTSPPGTSLKETDRLLRKVDSVLSSTPEVSSFSRRTGTELGFAITETNRGDYSVMLKSGRGRKIDKVMDQIRVKILKDIPGLDIDFTQVLQDLIGDLSGASTPVEVKVFGEDKKEIEDVADDLTDKLGKVQGLVDVKSGALESGPEYRFIVNPAEAGRRGISADQIADQAEASLGGTVATQILVGDRPFPVRVRLETKERSDFEALSHLGIQTPKGRVPLGELAKVDLVAGTTQSYREDQRRLVSVTAGLNNIDLGTATKKVREVVKGLQLPPGVHVLVAGQDQSQKESFANLSLMLGTAVVLVFTVMLFQFKSFTAPCVILFLMPLSVFGAFLALWLTQTALNVSSYMGLIMLAGIVVKNGILLLDHAQNAIEAGRPVLEAVLEAGARRLRPILMTTLTAILGLLPLAFGIGAGAEMQKPLAVAVVGGLTFSTFLTLLIGPILYASAAKLRKGARVKY